MQEPPDQLAKREFHHSRDTAAPQSWLTTFAREPRAGVPTCCCAVAAGSCPTTPSPLHPVVPEAPAPTTVATGRPTLGAVPVSLTPPAGLSDREGGPHLGALPVSDTPLLTQPSARGRVVSQDNLVWLRRFDCASKRTSRSARGNNTSRRLGSRWLCHGVPREAGAGGQIGAAAHHV